MSKFYTFQKLHFPDMTYSGIGAYLFCQIRYDCCTTDVALSDTAHDMEIVHSYFLMQTASENLV